MNSFKISEDGIIANIESLTASELRMALNKRGLISRPILSALRRTSRRFNVSYIRRLQQEGDMQHVSICRDSDSNESTAGSSVPCLPLWEPTNVNLAPWNSQYNENTNVREFIERVEELSTETNTLPEVISRCFLDVIAGNALLWYHSLKKESLPWLELKKLLIQKFEPPKAQHILKIQIFNRKQHSGESALDFFAEIRRNNRFLDLPVLEEELLIIFKYGLLPNYASLLDCQVISSAVQLETICKRFEWDQNTGNTNRRNDNCEHYLNNCVAQKRWQETRKIHFQNHTPRNSRYSWRSEYYDILPQADFSVPPPQIVKMENTLKHV